MQRSSLDRFDCSVARALDVIGEWWTPMILRDLFYGVHRFEQLQADLGIARNVLADRLATLVGRGVAEKVLYQQHPDRYEYRLTQMGRELLPVLLTLVRWGDRWLAGEQGPPVGFVHRTCGQETTPLLVCSACGEELRDRELVAQARHGQRMPGDAPLAR